MKFLKTKILLRSLAVAVLFGGCLTVKPVQADQLVLIAQSVWKPFSSKEGGFTVLMPGTPSQIKLPIDSQEGATTLIGFRVIRKNEANYMVGYADVPAGVKLNTPAERNKFLVEVATGFSTSLQGRILNQQTVNLGRYPGREIRVQFPQGVKGRQRLYLVKRRLYQLVVMTGKESSLSKSIQGFMDSFKLLSP